MIAIDQWGGGYTPQARPFPKAKFSVCFIHDWSPQFFSLISLLLVALLLPATLLAQGHTPSDALALEQQQKWAEAADVWKAVTTRNPNDAQAYAAMGVDL